MKMKPLYYVCKCQAWVISCSQGPQYAISDFSFQQGVSGIRSSTANCSAAKGELGAEGGNKAGRSRDWRTASQGPYGIQRQWPGWATAWWSPSESTATRQVWGQARKPSWRVWVWLRTQKIRDCERRLWTSPTQLRAAGCAQDPDKCSVVKPMKWSWSTPFM